MLHLLPQEEESFLRSESTSSYHPKALCANTIIQASSSLPEQDRSSIQQSIDFYHNVFACVRMKTEHQQSHYGLHHYHKRYPCEHLCLYLSKASELIPIVSAARAAKCSKMSLLVNSLDPKLLNAATALGIKQVYKVSAQSQIIKHLNSIKPSIDCFLYSGIKLPVLENMLSSSKIEFRHVRPPKDVAIISQNSTPVQDLAADIFYLISQKPCPKLYFITNSISYAKSLDKAIGNMIEFLKNKDQIKQNIPKINTIVTKTKQSIVDICKHISPEQLIILASSPKWYSNRIHTSSVVYIGGFLPKALAAYLGGIHSRSEDRWVSVECISPHMFVKEVHENYMEEENYNSLSPQAEQLARLEDDHCATLSINIRRIQYPK